jgi:hypothetical protein
VSARTEWRRVRKYDPDDARTCHLRDAVDRNFELTVDDLPDFFLFVRVFVDG